MRYQGFRKRIILKTVRKLRKETKENWNRVLPVGDYFSDRWEKARFLGFGEGTSVYDNVLVLGEVVVGKNTWVGPNSILDGSGGLTIGDNCSISAGVQIYSHDTVHWAISGGRKEYELASTTIESNVYIGPNTIVQKGVTIGSGSVIGANSLVNRDVPQNSKAWGTPCRVFGTTEDLN